MLHVFWVKVCQNTLSHAKAAQSTELSQRVKQTVCAGHSKDWEVSWYFGLHFFISGLHTFSCRLRILVGPHATGQRHSNT